MTDEAAPEIPEDIMLAAWDAIYSAPPSQPASARVKIIARAILAEREWRDPTDKDDEWTPAIEAAHPLKTRRYHLYDTATAMVGNRYSKGALVRLVAWLLCEREDAVLAERERCARVAEGLDPVTGDRAKLWLAHSLYDNMRKYVAAAIRAGGKMPRAAARFTQADIARALRAIGQEKARAAIEIAPSGTIRIVPLDAQAKGETPAKAPMPSPEKEIVL